MRQVDYIIVGQGITGTLLGWVLEKEGKSFIIIDDNHQQSSTKIAAGLINPITGRRFVKSWMIEELLPFAKQTYQKIERQTGLALWEDRSIVRYFQSTAEGNNWLTKTSYEGYGQFLLENALLENLDGVIYDTGGYGIIQGAKVAVGELIHYFQKYFLEKKMLLLQEFDYQQLKMDGNQVEYENITAQKILFCEGYAAFQNPWFINLPFESAKGEVLLLKIPDLKTQYILKKNQFLIPLKEDLFWFGSNYEWEELDSHPTLAGKQYLEERLSEILKLKYTIVDHLAAVRPVLKDRRPVIGLHPTIPQIAILNGMGTKGTSIAPYWVDQFVQFLVSGKSIPTEVGVDRFF